MLYKLNSKYNMKYKRICPICKKELEYKSYSAWYNANKSNSICRSCASKQKAQHCGDISKLLENTFEAWYWVGFLLADGSFNDNRLKLTLAIKDKEHLLKFASFIKYTGSLSETDKSVSVSVKDSDLVKKLCNKYEILSQKTYNPPTILSNLSKDTLYCILAGFIDGDGNIRNQNKREDFFLRIKNHSSWEDVLKLFGTLITNKDCVKINNQGYAELTISNTKILQDFKTKILSYNLPLLNRKWDIINMNFVSKYTKAEELRNQVIELLNKGLKQKEIAEICNTSPANVSKIKKLYGERK